jgi:hypothetical protein
LTTREGRTRSGWRAFETDRRGAVLTGTVTDYLGSRTVAYFATTIEVADGQKAALEFSTIDSLAVWVDGRFRGHMYPDRFAWYDFGSGPKHPTEYGAVALHSGTNRILVRVRGGQYATGGFYARVVSSS